MAVRPATPSPPRPRLPPTPPPTPSPARPDGHLPEQPEPDHRHQRLGTVRARPQQRRAGRQPTAGRSPWPGWSTPRAWAPTPPRDLRYTVPTGTCSFLASIGIDDEVGSNGSVTFQVLAGSTSLYLSPTLTGAAPPCNLNLAIPAGTTKLRLLVARRRLTNYDHADWADARCSCTAAVGPTRRRCRSSIPRPPAWPGRSARRSASAATPAMPRTAPCRPPT